MESDAEVSESWRSHWKFHMQSGKIPWFLDTVSGHHYNEVRPEVHFEVVEIAEEKAGCNSFSLQRRRARFAISLLARSPPSVLEDMVEIEPHLMIIRGEDTGTNSKFASN